MVRMGSIVRALLAATVATHALAAAAPSTKTKAASAQDEAATCVAPAVVSDLESKLQEMETTNAQWSAQLETASSKWEEEKAEMVAALSAAEAQHRDEKRALEAAQAEAEEKAAASTTQLTARESEWNAREREWKAKVDALTSELTQAQAAVASEKSAVATAQTVIQTLEQEVAQGKKQNDALLAELASAGGDVSLLALLSSYYDEGIVAAQGALASAQEQLVLAQDSSSPVGQALESVYATKRALYESSGQLYAEHLAATVDPVLADLSLAADPYVAQYRPLVEAEVGRATQTVSELYQVGEKRAWAARDEAKTLLKQNESVAPFAERIVDGSLVVLAVPLVYLAVRVSLRLVWWTLCTIVYVTTCGLCCGKCSKKRSKAKRKPSARKQVSSVPTTSVSTSNSTTASKGSGNRRNNGSKKQK